MANENLFNVNQMTVPPATLPQDGSSNPFAGANVIVQPGGAGAGANPAALRIQLAQSMEATDPISGFLKGRAIGKASDAIDKYEQQLMLQANTVKAQKEQLDTINKMNEQVATGVQTTLRSGYGQSALSNDPQIAIPALKQIFAHANAYSRLNGAPGLNIDPDSVIDDGNGTVVYDTVNPDGSRITHRDNKLQMITQYSDPETRTQLQLTQSNEKPGYYFTVDTQGHPNENVPLIKRADGGYTDTMGNPVQGQVFLNRADFEAKQAMDAYTKGQDGKPINQVNPAAMPAPAGALAPLPDNLGQPQKGQPVDNGGLTGPVAGTAPNPAAAIAKELNNPVVDAVNGVETMPVVTSEQVVSSPQMTQIAGNIKSAKPGSYEKALSSDNVLKGLAWDYSKPATYIPDKDTRAEVRAIGQNVAKDTQIENFATGVASFSTALNLAKDATGASDQALVYAINKTFDPPSTVREGEAAALMDLGNLSANLQVKVNNVLKAGNSATKEKFTPQERAELLGAANAYLKGGARGYQQAVGMYANQLKETLGPNADLRSIMKFDPARVDAVANGNFDFKKELGIGTTSVDTSAFDNLSDDQLQAIATGKAKLKDFTGN